MEKIKNKIIYILGSFLAFIYNASFVFAEQKYKDFIIPERHLMYGVDPSAKLINIKEPTFWEKFLNIILSPLFITIILILSLSIGTFIFIKKRKNAKKNIKTRKTKTVDNS